MLLTLYLIYISLLFETDPFLSFSIINIESEWHSTKIGDHGKSFGLMQIKCSTAKELGFVGKCKKLLEPTTNIYYGVFFLSKKVKMWGEIPGIAAYNSGKPRYKNKKLRNKKYVEKVLKYRKSLIMSTP